MPSIPWDSLAQVGQPVRKVLVVEDGQELHLHRRTTAAGHDYQLWGVANWMFIALMQQAHQGFLAG